jgi:hypothetical protein
VSKRFMREIQRARFLREAMGLKRQFEVLEGSKGFRRKAERSGRQPVVQEDRRRSEGQLRAQKGCQIFRGSVGSSVGQEGGLRFSRASRGSTGQSEVQEV